MERKERKMSKTELPTLAVTPGGYRLLCEMAELEVDRFRAEMEAKDYHIDYPDDAEEIPAELAELQKAAADNVVSVVLSYLGITRITPTLAAA